LVKLKGVDDDGGRKELMPNMDASVKYRLPNMKCFVCGKLAYGRATRDWTAALCRFHFDVARANGFEPRPFVSKEVQ
jgi:hypothetical protein